MKLYRFLMILYPAPFRWQYQARMEQAFRDQLRDSKDHRRLWLHTLYDLLQSAPALHLEENMQTLAAFACALAAVLFLGRFELHSDDTGVEVAFVLLFTFILGYWQPKRAWIFSLIGLSIPLAELVWGAPSLKKAALIGLFVMVISVTGSVTGVLARRMMAPVPKS